MNMPMWNHAWERPDPLRGKRGWVCADYVNIGVTLGLVILAVGLLALVNARLRYGDLQMKRFDEVREQQLFLVP